MNRINALTVDVEDYFHVAALSKSIDRKDWPSLPSRVERNTHRLLELFGERRIHATFFVLGWITERYPALVREIHAQGHEVACHGMSHEMIYSQTPEAFEDETIRAKAALEDLIGSPVLGYRAASYSITEASLWAMDVIARAGFQYDSSIAPTRHDLYGIPGARRDPHMFETRSGAKIVEFPVTTLSILGVSVPIGGGGYFRLYPYWLSAALLRRINGSHDLPFIFYLHPWEIDPDQPRVRASLLSSFRHYLNLDKTEKRLQSLIGEFRFDTVQTVLSGIGLLAAPGRA